jgi:peptide/nickel transport system substrate-binding protein
MASPSITPAWMTSAAEGALGRRDVLRGSALGGAALLASTVLGSRIASAAATPKKGGNLRVAVLGGTSADSLDAHTAENQADVARVMMLYESLTTITNQATVANQLADSLEANADATEWTIRLKKGVKFHDGQTLGAADVIASFNRIANPKNPLAGASGLAQVDLANMKIIDDLTVRIPMKSPYAAFPQCISAQIYFGIVPANYDPKKPVGTGPFKYKSFTPGQQSVMTRFDEYWGEPAFLDEITLTDFQTETAAFNALQGGEIDVFANAPLTLIRLINGNGALKAVVNGPGQWTPFTMRIDQAPFNDPNVRLAMRLLVDRKQMINVALGGYGVPGADVFAPNDPCYDKSLHRERDLDRAKFLLRKAGQENMKVELVTADIANGTVQQAQVFAQQAKAAGVTVSLRNTTPDVFFGDQYLKWTFAQDFWYYSPYLSQCVQGYLPSSLYNETHWVDDQWEKLYAQAQSIVDETKRCEIIHEMQKIDFEKGGYIIASYNQSVDLMAQNVHGFEPGLSGFALGTYSWAKGWMS